MTKRDVMKHLRSRIEEEKARGDLHSWTAGFAKGLETALFFLGEKQAVRDHEEAMARIRAERSAEECRE